MRMERENRPLRNHLNNFASRTWRPLYQMISWHGAEDRGNETKVVLDKLSEAQKEANSTRGSTPGWSEKGWIPHPETRKGRGECRAPRRGQVFKSHKAKGLHKAQPSSQASKQLEQMLEQSETGQREEKKSNGANVPEFQSQEGMCHKLRHREHHDISLDNRQSESPSRSQQSDPSHQSINEWQILWGNESAISARNGHNSDRVGLNQPPII